MRKILLVLAVLLLSAPAWAAVNVNCVVLDVSGPNDTVAVQYEVVGGDPNLPRGFGIRIDVNNGAGISDIDVNDAEYYIFPGSIDINDSNGNVDGWGSAVVAGFSDGDPNFTLEMGSLYDPCDVEHPSAPPSSGTLCTFKVSKECCVTISRDTARGGVVMEDQSDYASLNGTCVSYFDCFPQGHADWSEYDTVGRPDCWCYPRQCHGDVDNASEGKGGFWVYTADLNIMMSAWAKTLGNLTGNEICADFDHALEGKGNFRVYTADLNIMMANWASSSTPADCP